MPDPVDPIVPIFPHLGGWYTAGEVAKAVGLKPAQVKEHIAAKKLKGDTNGEEAIFTTADVERYVAWLNKKAGHATPGAAAAPEPKKRRSRPPKAKAAKRGQKADPVNEPAAPVNKPAAPVNKPAGPLGKMSDPPPGVAQVTMCDEEEFARQQAAAGQSEATPPENGRSTNPADTIADIGDMVHPAAGDALRKMMGMDVSDAAAPASAESPFYDGHIQVLLRFRFSESFYRWLQTRAAETDQNPWDIIEQMVDEKAVEEMAFKRFPGGRREMVELAHRLRGAKPDAANAAMSRSSEVN